MEKTEDMYLELERLGRVLGVPVPQCHITLETFDKNGEQVSYYKRRSHTWTRNAFNHMFSQLAGKDLDDTTTFAGGFLNIKMTNGTVHHSDKPSCIVNISSTAATYSADDANATSGGYRGPAGNALYGIQVGTGTGAESFEDYVLGTLIDTGNGAGELAYGEQEAHAETYTAGTLTYEADLVRYFNNNSGGAITVAEVALVARGQFVSENQYSLMSRDKLDTGVEVADTGQLKVTITISLIFGG